MPLSASEMTLIFQSVTRTLCSSVWNVHCLTFVRPEESVARIERKYFVPGSSGEAAAVHLVTNPALDELRATSCPAASRLTTSCIRAGVSVPNSKTAAVGPIATGTAFWMHCTEQPRPDEMPPEAGATFVLILRVENVPLRESVRPSTSVAERKIR